MQGPSKRGARISVALGFAAAFIAGAALIFWIVTAAGEFFGIASLPWRSRVWIAAAGLVLLASADLVAIVKASYCPITLRRQTPHRLMRRHDLRFVALVWGFDTGLLVTTFRVAAVSWAALLLTALGFSGGWTGIAYGAAFAVPFVLLLFRPRLGRASRGNVPEDPGFAAMLARRPLLQGASAVSLAAGGAALLLF